MEQKEDFELTLFDRIEAIKLVNEKYNLEENAYLSFSGGKDSTVLHYLLDEALPNNKIPRVYIDTGIEYNDVRNYVIELSKKDERIIIVKPELPIKLTLEKYGYPFKSKDHSNKIARYNNGTSGYYIERYLKGINEDGTPTKFKCPNILVEQFTPEYKKILKISVQCCFKMKKEPAHKWAKANNKTMTITGMRQDEGGQRTHLDCFSNNYTKFHPLVKVSEEWENWYIKERNIQLCKLYYPPFNFVRTGCAGCPFALELKKQLEILNIYLPKERRKCEIIWKPVYDEYRRLNYRLEKIEQTKLF